MKLKPDLAQQIAEAIKSVGNSPGGCLRLHPQRFSLLRDNGQMNEQGDYEVLPAIYMRFATPHEIRKERTRAFLRLEGNSAEVRVWLSTDYSVDSTSLSFSIPTKTNDTSRINDQMRSFIENMPMIEENLRGCALHALDRLDTLDVGAEAVIYLGDNTFTLRLPLVGSPWSIGMVFGFNYEDSISCGPSHFPATNETVDRYIGWLDKHMPRRGESRRDIIKAGNPDGLILTPPSEEADLQSTDQRSSNTAGISLEPVLLPVAERSA